VTTFIRIILFVFCLAFTQDTPSSTIFWNSLSTSLDIGIPLSDDPSLDGGRIQLQVSFNDQNSFADLGQPFIIESGDVDDVKMCSVPSDQFETMNGFQEGGTAHFNAIVWDRAGNSLTGTVSDSILTIDETIPSLVSLTMISSNPLDPLLATDADSIVFDFVASEAILPPEFEINGDAYDAVGIGKSWKVIYPAKDADDGEIEFNITFKDLADNPGPTITKSLDETTIIKDGQEPELEDIMLFTSNPFDSLLAVAGDSVFLQFSSDEPIRDIIVSLNGNVGNQVKEDSLTYIYYHIFTSSDSERVIPISILYNDMAGNPGELVEETTDNSEVTFDQTPPEGFTISSIGSSQGEFKKFVSESQSDSTSSTHGGMGSVFQLSDMVIYGIGGTLGFFCLLIWVSWFKIFSKAGQAGWKAFIPIFNLFVLTKILNKPIWWLVIYLLLPISWFIVPLQLSNAFSKKVLFAVGLIFLPFIFYPILAFGKSQYGEANEPKVPKKEKKSKKKKKK